MKTDKIILSRWFLFSMLLMALILPPFASKGFIPSEIGNIVATTLSNSFVKYLVPFSFIFQFIALLFFVVMIIRKSEGRAFFLVFVGSTFLIASFVQNIAITEKFGLSFIVSNIILMLLTALIWFRDIKKGGTKFSFENITRKNSWLIAVALFCFWWPMNFSGNPDFNLLHFFTGHVAQAVQFCPMTPIFLIILILCKPTISLPVYRMTAISGTLIGFWNMMNFFNPSTIYVGIYHLPLFLISLYALIDSFKIQNNHV